MKQEKDKHHGDGISSANAEERLKKILAVIESIESENFGSNIPVCAADSIGQIEAALNNLKTKYEKIINEGQLFQRISENINAGVTLDQVLSLIYDQFKYYIPYDRIGLALLDETGDTVKARWAKSETVETELPIGYSAKMEGSSLQKIIETGAPRIINDLEDYLRKNPQSDSTRKIVAEGVRSSLTCPLISLNKPVGFLFFSSSKKNTYRDIHIEIFYQIARQVSVIVEKGRLYQDLTELNQLKNKFVGIVAHDLRSPLGVLKGFLEILLKGIFGELNEMQRKYLLKMNGVCENMLLLIDDLLDVSAIESGNLKLELMEHDMERFLHESHEYNSILAKSKSIELVLDAEANLPRVVMDKNRITQVVNNLISNAIKYSFPNSKITIVAKKSDEEIAISVQDQGQGIPDHEIPRIFAHFGRGSVKPTGGEKSIGLGLAIVKSIIKSHEGHIWVKSKVGEGSIFSFSIPITGPHKITEKH